MGQIGSQLYDMLRHSRMFESDLKFENCTLSISEKSAKDEAEGLKEESADLKKKSDFKTDKPDRWKGK